MYEWVSPALVGCGIAFQLWREAKKSGARESKLEAHEARLNSHSTQLGKLRDEQEDLVSRVSTIEGRCDAMGPALHAGHERA